MPSVHWRYAATWNWQNWPRHRTVRHVELRLQPAHRKRGRSPSCLVYLIGEILEYFGRWVLLPCVKRYVSKFYWTFGHLLFGDGHSHLDDGNSLCLPSKQTQSKPRAKKSTNEQTQRRRQKPNQRQKQKNTFEIYIYVYIYRIYVYIYITTSRWWFQILVVRYIFYPLPGEMIQVD